MPIEQLRADYADLKECSHYPAMERIMSAMPKILDVLEAGIAWRAAACDNSDGFEIIRACDLIKALDRFDK